MIGIIYGAVGCLAQTDMKRLIAFSSVAHMGFVMLGIASLTDFGINAAIFGMVAHGLITGMLFFLAGSVQHNFHTRELSRLGGLLVQAPKMGWILGFCVMASLGLPGLAGFWGEFPAILSAFEPGLGLSEAGVPRLHGDRRGRHRARGRIPPVDAPEGRVRDTEAGVRGRVTSTTSTRSSGRAWLPILLLILVLGIFPGILFRITDGAVTQMVDAMAQVVGS